ncbi:MAG: hypothetical protein KJZ78_10640 [Bryobacteraceae bacterium]|nr:hypothetical protein [Bryobacteraceae bacterium]
MDYEALALVNGEVHLYLDTASPIDAKELQARLTYAYSHQREHLTSSDPWESAFFDTRFIPSEAEFLKERDRVVEIMLSAIPGQWDASLTYYPPGRASGPYHWSSSEGILHPYRTVNLDSSEESYE